jgi:hypothetical protein
MVNMSDDVMNENSEKPEGADFFVDLPDGHRVWFRDFGAGQRMMLMRSGEQASRRAEAITAGSGTDEEKFFARQAVIARSNKHLWDAIDAAMISKDDIERVMDAMIADEIGMDWAWTVFRRGEPESVVEADDIEEVKPAKPSRRANAKRTQVR